MIPAHLLPPIPQPPHDPTFTLLGPGAGWKALSMDQTAIDPATEELRLATLPGAERSLTEPSGSLGGLVPPANVAIDSDRGIWLVDPSISRVKQFNVCTRQFEEVPCQEERLSAARAAAVRGEWLLVTDGASRSVVALSLPSLAPRGAWRPPANLPELPNPWDPWGIAVDGRRRAWVADPANGGVHRFSASGKWEKFVGGLGTCRYVAADLDGRIYCVSDYQPEVTVLDGEGSVIESTASLPNLSKRFAPMPFGVDRDGNLYLGGLCQPATVARFDLSGNLIAPGGSPLKPHLATSGFLISGPLDSRIYRCQWHRVVLTGMVPRGGSIRVRTYTSEAVVPPEHLALPDLPWYQHPVPVRRMSGDWDCLIQSPPGRYLWLRLDLEGDGFFTPWLEQVRIEFPRVSLRRYLPAVFGEDPVSADFTDRFLSVFDTSLRSIETKVDTQAAYYDPRSTPATVDPRTGIDFLSWLGSWIGVSLERQMPEAQRRQILADAGATLRIRGTRDGLWQQLLQLMGWDEAAGSCPADCTPAGRCSGRPPCPPEPCRRCSQPPPLILEHFQIRRWLFEGVAKLGSCAELWGRRIVNRSQLDAGAQVGGTQLVMSNDPVRDPFHYTAHRFTVFAPACFESSDSRRRSLFNLLRSESPAHTKYEVEFVKPRFRIGFQSSIGLNSVVARVPQGVTLDESTLATDSVLTGTRQRRLPSEIGATTLLSA